MSGLFGPKSENSIDPGYNMAATHDRWDILYFLSVFVPIGVNKFCIYSTYARSQSVTGGSGPQPPSHGLG